MIHIHCKCSVLRWEHNIVVPVPVLLYFLHMKSSLTSPISPVHHYISVLGNADPVLQVAFFMILVCQVILGVSRRGCTFLLNMVQYILHLTLVQSGRPLSLHDQKLLVDIPKDFRSVDARFSQDSKHQENMFFFNALICTFFPLCTLLHLKVLRTKFSKWI